MFLVSDQFAHLAHIQAESLGMGAIACAVFPHPLGGLSTREVTEKAAPLFEIVDHFSTAAPQQIAADHLARCDLRADGGGQRSARRLALSSEPESIADYLEDNRLGDGLPVVPPTLDRVSEMLEWTDYDAADVIGMVYPNGAPATAEKVAANAVMAGCRPKFFPLVIAAVRAVTRPQFNLIGLQATTHPVAPLLVFSGPLALQAGLNSGAGLFGPGVRANATIGRALRLVMLNVGGGDVGQGDKATHGQPGKYTFCIAENEVASPWEPLRVELGYPEEASTVTVVPAEAPHNIYDGWSISSETLLEIICGSIKQMGSNNAWGMDPDMLLILGPEHAAMLARDGITKSDIQRYVFEHARTMLSDWPDVYQQKVFAVRYPERFLNVDPRTTPVPMIFAPDRLLVIVAGGAGAHSLHVPTFGTRSLTEPITMKSGEYARYLEEFRR